MKTTAIYQTLSDAYDRGKRIAIFQGGARSGKTYNIILWLITQALTSKVDISIVRKTLPALKGSAMRDYFDICDALGITPDFGKTTNIARFASGATIEFFSTDDEQKLRGRKRDILFINEANDLTALEYQQLAMRTSRMIIVDYNPSITCDHWLYGLRGKDNVIYSQTTYRDNPFLPPEIINEIEGLRDKNPTLWQIYGLGEMAQIEGVVFPMWDTLPEIPATAKHSAIGIDYGYTHDPTAIINVAWEGDNLYCDEIAYRTHMLTGDIISALKQAGAKYVVSESADPRLIDEIHLAGVNIYPTKKGAGSVQAGIQRMQAMHLHITQRSENLQKELKNYTYLRDKNGKYLNEPIDAFNHAIDAVRYVVIDQMGTNKGNYTIRVR